MESKPLIPNFIELLEQTYENEEAKYVEKEGYRHNPSNASLLTEEGKAVGACIRSLYWKATKEPVTDKKALTVKLQGDFGNGIHDRLYHVLKKSDKIKLTSELPGKVIVDPLTQEISYRLDAVVDHKGESGYLEVKTMQSFALRQMALKGNPREKDVLQVLVGLGVNPELRWGSLLYFGRDNAYRAQYNIYKDDALGVYMIQGVVPASRAKPIKELSFKKVVERWKELEGHVERKELPKRDYKVVLRDDGTVTDHRDKNLVTYESDKACLYCSYKSKCWSLPDAKEESYKVGL